MTDTILLIADTNVSSTETTITLAGIVATLVAALVWVIKAGKEHLDKSNDTNRQNMAAVTSAFNAAISNCNESILQTWTEHKAERAEWRNESNAREDRLIQCVDDLTKAIRESHLANP